MNAFWNRPLVNLLCVSGLLLLLLLVLIPFGPFAVVAALGHVEGVCGDGRVAGVALHQRLALPQGLDSGPLVQARAANALMS